MRSVLACLAAVLPALSLAAPEPIKIGALVAITGPAAFLGAPEARTLEMLVQDLNAKGGIAGRPVKLVLKDTGASPEKAVSFAKQLIDEEMVFAILGPSTSGESTRVKPIAEDGKTLMLSMAAAEEIVNPVVPHVFSVAPSDGHAVELIFQRMRKMGITRIGFLSSNTGFGKSGKGQVEKLAPQHGITLAANEVYDKNATDLTAEVTKLKAANVQAILNWSIEPAQSIVVKNARQLGLTVPIFQSHGFANLQYVKAAGNAAEGVIFPASRIVVAGELAPGNPQKPVVEAYRKAYETRYGEDVSTFGGHAWDAFGILIAAIEQVGPDRAKVRAAVENMKGFPGTAGIFNFSPTAHNGLDISAFELCTVKNGRFAPLGN